MRTSRPLAIASAAILGVGSAFAIASCGEDRGGVEVEGGSSTTGTTGTTSTTGTPPTTTTP
jgi:hypothetical protein